MNRLTKLFSGKENKPAGKAPQSKDANNPEQGKVGRTRADTLEKMDVDHVRKARPARQVELESSESSRDSLEDLFQEGLADRREFHADSSAEESEGEPGRLLSQVFSQTTAAPGPRSADSSSTRTAVAGPGDTKSRPVHDSAASMFRGRMDLSQLDQVDLVKHPEELVSVLANSGNSGFLAGVLSNPHQDVRTALKALPAEARADLKTLFTAVSKASAQAGKGPGAAALGGTFSQFLCKTLAMYLVGTQNHRHYTDHMNVMLQNVDTIFD